MNSTIILTGVTTLLRNSDACHVSGEQIWYVTDTTTLQIFTVNGRNRTNYIDLLLNAVAHNYDFVKGFYVGTKRDGHVRLSSNRLVGIANVRYCKHATFGSVKRETAINVGYSTIFGSLLLDGCADNRLSMFI